MRRLPPADPRRVRAEGEPAPVTSLSERLPARGSPEKGNPAPPKQEVAGHLLAQPVVAISQQKLEEILDKQDRLVRWLTEVKEQSDQTEASLKRLNLLFLELVSRLEAEGHPEA